MNRQYAPVFYSFLKDPSLSPGAARVFGSLLTYSRCDLDTGEWSWCNPSYASITDDTGLSRTSIYRYITELKERGYLRTRPRPGDPTEYLPLFPETRSANGTTPRSANGTGQSEEEESTRSASGTTPVPQTERDPFRKRNPKYMVEEVDNNHPASTQSDSPEPDPTTRSANGTGQSERPDSDPPGEDVASLEQNEPPPSDHDIGQAIDRHMLLKQRTVGDKETSLDNEVRGFHRLAQKRGLDLVELLGAVQHFRGVIEPGSHFVDRPCGIGLLDRNPPLLEQALSAYRRAQPASDIAKTLTEAMNGNALES